MPTTAAERNNNPQRSQCIECVEMGEAKAAFTGSPCRSLLRRTTGHDVRVRPVLIFAGWYVEQRSRGPEVWVLNENHLPAYLDHEERRLSPEDVALYAERLGSTGHTSGA